MRPITVLDQRGAAVVVTLIAGTMDQGIGSLDGLTVELDGGEVAGPKQVGDDWFDRATNRLYEVVQHGDAMAWERVVG